jgi:hypothetical protein
MLLSLEHAECDDEVALWSCGGEMLIWCCAQAGEANNVFDSDDPSVKLGDRRVLCRFMWRVSRVVFVANEIARADLWVIASETGR